MPGRRARAVPGRPDRAAARPGPAHRAQPRVMTGRDEHLPGRPSRAGRGRPRARRPRATWTRLVVAAARGGRTIRWVLVTHTHPDHAPGRAGLWPRGPGPRSSGSSARDGFAPDRPVGRRAGRWTGPAFDLRAVHTPGHAGEPPVLAARGAGAPALGRPRHARLHGGHPPARRRHGRLPRQPAPAPRTSTPPWSRDRPGPRPADRPAGDGGRRHRRPPARARAGGGGRRWPRPARPPSTTSCRSSTPTSTDDARRRWPASRCGPTCASWLTTGGPAAGAGPIDDTRRRRSSRVDRSTAADPPSDDQPLSGRRCVSARDALGLASRRQRPAATASSTCSSIRAVQPDVSTTGATSSATGGPARRRPGQLARRRGPPARPASPPAGHVGVERDGADQRDAQLGGQPGTAAGAEQGVGRAVLAGEVAHVLDDPGDPQVAPPGHVGRPGGHLLGGQGRRGDDQHLGARAACGPGPSARRRCPAAGRSGGSRGRPSGRPGGTAGRPG